ncbi:MAG TPA: S8 family serine peptidase, partial [Chitinophagales bacterium]|nr:S8 family serine peptidase [Chitinophagales bacterium]
VNQWALQKISAEQAWDVSHGSSNVVVAIVDNGVRINHQDLSGNLWTNTGETANNGLDDDFNGYTDDVHGYDVADNDADPSPPTGISQSDEWNHGTHCAGIASAATNNGTGIASVGFNTRIMAVKCTKSSSGNGGQLTNVDDGITYAMRNGANVISMSFGSNGSSVTEQLLISSCINKGIVMVAAAGNDDTTAAFYPAAYNGVICVGATDQNDKKASFSNYGSRVDVMAPGVGIYSTLASGSGSDYGFFSGTSMACPMVAGLAGLVLAVHPSFTPAQVANQIKSTADNISAENPGLNGMLGGGRINASRAIGGSTSTGITAVNALTGVKLFPNPFSSQVAITGLIPNGNCVIECYDMEGRRVATPVNAQGTGAVVETSGLATGAYIIKLTSGGESACFRLMKF